MKTAALLEKIDELESAVDALLVVSSALILASKDKPDLLQHLRELIAKGEGDNPVSDEYLERIQASITAHVDAPQVLH